MKFAYYILSVNTHHEYLRFKRVFIKLELLPYPTKALYFLFNID